MDYNWHENKNGTHGYLFDSTSDLTGKTHFNWDQIFFDLGK